MKSLSAIVSKKYKNYSKTKWSSKRLSTNLSFKFKAKVEFIVNMKCKSETSEKIKNKRIKLLTTLKLKSKEEIHKSSNSVRKIPFYKGRKAAEIRSINLFMTVNDK